MLKNNFSYEILPDLNLVIRSFSGIIQLNDILQSFDELEKDAEFSKNMNFLSDIRDVEIIFSANEIKTLIEKIQSNINIYGERISVLLTESPNQALFGGLIDYYKRDKNIKLSIVSTVEYSLSLLGIAKENDQIVIDTLKKLKKKSEK